MSGENCRRYEEALVAYLDGELAREEARGLEEHLKGCSRCAEEMEGFRSARAALAAVPRLKASDSFRESLEEKLASLHFPAPVRERKGRHWLRRKIVYFAPSLAACAAFLVVAHFWVLAAVEREDEYVLDGTAAARQKMILELPAEAIFERMISGSELDVSFWIAEGALYLKGRDDFYSADRCIFAFLPAEWGAQPDKKGGVKVVVENGRFLVPEDMRSHYLDGSNDVTVLHKLEWLRSEIWNSARLRRFLSTPQHIPVGTG